MGWVVLGFGGCNPLLAPVVCMGVTFFAEFVL